MEDREAIMAGLQAKLKSMIEAAIDMTEQFQNEFPRRIMFEYSLLGYYEHGESYVLKLMTDDGFVKVVSDEGSVKNRVSSHSFYDWSNERLA